MEVFVKAQYLASYTAQILSNEKIFNPETDTELIARIKNCAYDIYAKAWTANKIRADSSVQNRAWRDGLQEEAILLCHEMLAYIGIAKTVFHLHRKRMKYWGNMILEVAAMLQAWRESDVKRYGKL